MLRGCSESHLKCSHSDRGTPFPSTVLGAWPCLTSCEGAGRGGSGGRDARRPSGLSVAPPASGGGGAAAARLIYLFTHLCQGFSQEGEGA